MSRPNERFRFGVGLFDEAVDGLLEIANESKDAAFEAAFGELGEEAFDGVEPGSRGRSSVDAG